MNGRPPVWERDEILLVLEHGHKRGWPASVSPRDPEIIRLSRQLRKNRGLTNDDDSPKVRNPNGVVRKYGDLYSQMPTNSVRTTNGGELTREIVEQYLESPEIFF